MKNRFITLNTQVMALSFSLSNFIIQGTILFIITLIALFFNLAGETILETKYFNISFPEKLTSTWTNFLIISIAICLLAWLAFVLIKRFYNYFVRNENEKATLAEIYDNSAIKINVKKFALATSLTKVILSFGLLLIFSVPIFQIFKDILIEKSSIVEDWFQILPASIFWWPFIVFLIIVLIFGSIFLLTFLIYWPMLSLIVRQYNKITKKLAPQPITKEEKENRETKEEIFITIKPGRLSFAIFISCIILSSIYILFISLLIPTFFYSINSKDFFITKFPSNNSWLLIPILGLIWATKSIIFFAILSIYIWIMIILTIKFYNHFIKQENKKVLVK